MKLAALAMLCGTLSVAGDLRFARIPAGSFEFGCPAGYTCAENFPKKLTTFDQPFEISKYETTVDQFRAFTRATGYRTEAEVAGDKGNWTAPGYPLSGKQPVVYVTLNDAEAFCAWAGGRVPTEAEWEYAARAGATGPHYWGDQPDPRYMWYFDNSNLRAQPVGKKLPNAWGLYDVQGNAFEWVKPHSAHSSIDKPGHGSLRGGSWMTCPEPYPPKNGQHEWQIWLGPTFSIFKASSFDPHFRRYDVGFRCVR
jgi:formylglycine-generating enzyme required for sulfatase activity